MPKTRKAARSDEDENHVASAQPIPFKKETRKRVKPTLPEEDIIDVHYWFEEDVKLLVEKICSATIENKEMSSYKIDTLIDWDQVKFGRFTVGECQRMWTRMKEKVSTTRRIGEYCSALKK